MDAQQIIFSLHPLERTILPHVSLKEVSLIAQKTKLKKEEVSTGLQMLATRGLVTYTASEQTYVGLDKLGERYVDSDLPEIQFLKKVLDEAKTKEELALDNAEFSSALGFLKKNHLVVIEKKDKVRFVATDNAQAFLDSYSNPLKLFTKDVLVSGLGDKQKKHVKLLQKRGLLCTTTRKSADATLNAHGKAVLKLLQEDYADLSLADALTPEMLKSGAWKDVTCRHYDTALEVPYVSVGRRHPMIEANNVLRDVFVEMGFSEMEGPMVESAFWNMDVMWIPQDHPARDEQDTFYLDGAAKLPRDLVTKYKQMHENGIKRTHTNKGDWSKDIAAKRLLRTHSTATSFRVLAYLAKKHKGDIPNGKYFYCAENFRNEAVDATHLNDFFQAEGFIIGDDLSLADLMGFVKEFYAKLGIHKIRFKPTYNPYTEPSMEAHYYDAKMGKWYALINSGVFRAETLEPLGIKKRIIAWGMGSSRVAALLAQKRSMRDITGLTCDFAWLAHRPMMTREIVRK